MKVRDSGWDSCPAGVHSGLDAVPAIVDAKKLIATATLEVNCITAEERLIDPLHPVLMRNAGRGEAHEPETHLIPLILDVALRRREKIFIYGDDYSTPDGTCIRDYIHVVDLAAAHILALDALGTKDRMIFNLGNGSGFSVKEVIESARRVTGHAIPVELKPRREGDPARLVASSEKAKAELGWVPKTPELDGILASAWEWHQQRYQ